MNRRTLLLLLLTSLSGTAGALVLGGTNLGVFGYPSHQCIKPDKPSKPFSFDSRWEVDSYNSRANSYNSELQFYVACVKDYLSSAENDIKRINEKMEAAVAEAKRPSY